MTLFPVFPETVFSGNATDSSSSNSNSNFASSSSSTPPTTAEDSASLHSDSSKHDVITVAPEDAAPVVVVATGRPQPEDMPMPDAPTPPRPKKEEEEEEESPATSPRAPRSRRSCAAAPVYNLSKLSGTDGHGKRRANGDDVADRRRRTISGDTLVNDSSNRSPAASTRSKLRGGRDAIDALDLRYSPAAPTSPRATRRNMRGSGHLAGPSRGGVPGAVSSLGAKIAKIGKRGRSAVGKSVGRVSRELMRLQDTNEFSHVDDRPVRHTVWSNGKYVDPNEPPAPPPKKANVEDDDDDDDEEQKQKEKESSEPITNTKKRRVKKFLAKGLYAGQEMPRDLTKGLTTAEKKKLAQLPELATPARVNKVMPTPIYTGFRMLIAGRDFTLPFMTCNPLPSGQPKPDEWKKMTKNRFIGDSKDYWRKTPHFHDVSKCICTPEDGCGDNCQNRIMLYECDEGNCSLGKELCTNRAFTSLAARRAKGGKYRVGVEVIKTSDRGYGVRSNRCFRPHQIIMEYAGEIITEEECERRMNEVYKNNDCYYLMSFDQNMIIDATTGSIARFVNHSCNPNCRMIKWIVSGQPRMALFAGDNPIMTGDELTYDYNFDPFSAKNVQTCLCGSENCRGFLGPRPRGVKPPKTDLKKTVKGAVKAGKRKLKEMMGDEPAGGNKAKKRKILPATGVKRSLSNASIKAAKGAATAIRKSMSSISLSGKKGQAKGTPVKRRASTGALLKKATTGKKLTKAQGKAPAKPVSSRSSSLTIVAASEENIRAGKKGTPKKGTPKKGTPKKATPSKVTPKSKASPGKATSVKGKPSPKSVTPKTANRRLSGKGATPKSKSPRKGMELSPKARAKASSSSSSAS